MESYPRLPLKEAKLKALEIQSSIDHGIGPFAPAITLESAFERFLNEYAEHHQPRSWRDTKLRLEKYLIKPYGDRKSERRIRQDRCLSGVGVEGHLPDGLLELHDSKPTAIELGLSTKGWRRLKGIIADYAADLDIGDVWYFAGSDALYRRLCHAADGYDFIKIHSWPMSPPCNRPCLGLSMR